MEETDIKAPLLYVMGRDIAEAGKVAAHCVFSITPCYTGLIGRHSDYGLAQQFTQAVMRVIDETACTEIGLHLARHQRFPVLTIGDGEGLTAVYSNGDEEEICLSKLTSMN